MYINDRPCQITFLCNIYVFRLQNIKNKLKIKVFSMIYNQEYYIKIKYNNDIFWYLSLAINLNWVSVDGAVA